MPFLPFLSFLAVATAAIPAPTPSSIALLVNQPDGTAIAEPLRVAIGSDDPLTRATAARVIAVRGIDGALPAVREQLAHENDAAAAREEIRALAWLGTMDDVAAAITASSKWPPSMDADLASAVARRGGSEAVDIYLSKLGPLRRLDRRQFFRMALWGRPALLALTSSRVLGASDAEGWRALLAESRASAIALDAGIVIAGMNSGSDDIRSESVWYVARGYAADPSQIPPRLREAFSGTPVTSDREAFGRELVSRMSGSEKRDDPRWLAWLDSAEADQMLASDKDPDFFSWFTDTEFASRKQRCGVLPTECAMPPKRMTARVPIPSQPVAAPDYFLPTDLPPGLAAALLTCDDGWIGVATTVVSPSARVESIDLGSTTAGRCAKPLEAILKLSLPLNATITSPHKSANVLLVRGPRAPLCLDEAAPSDAGASEPLPSGGRVVAPKAQKRVQPKIPPDVLRQLGANRSASFIFESVITREGCVRNIRFITQSPFPALNAEAVKAISQWKFYPGTLDGKPVDVIFTISFSISAGRM